MIKKRAIPIISLVLACLMLAGCGAQEILDTELFASPTPGITDNSEQDGEQLQIEGTVTDESEADTHGDLVINEAVSYNNFYAASDGEYYDWVEIKNLSEEPVDLSEYYLSDDKDDLEKYNLPEVTLDGGELIVIYCSKKPELSKDGEYHADFSISPGEKLYLTMADGTLSDSLKLKNLPTYGSRGRMDGEEGYFYFAKPTPGADNINGYHKISDEPVADAAPGVYNDVASVTVALTGEGTIYYTTDGSVPTVGSEVYTEPFELEETAVIRAACVEEGKMISKTATFSYIINEYDDLPVTSLVCDPDEMFKSETGVFYADRIENASCDGDVVFFDDSGEGFQALCSIELHGANSRVTYDKKSFQLKFSSRYGGDVEYDLFGDETNTSFSSLLLRGGAAYDLYTLRDTLASEAMEICAPELYPQATRYSILYINGEYYGIYAWREDYSEDYFARHTGADTDEITMDRAIVNSGELAELFDYIANHSMTNSNYYSYVESVLDLESVAKWLAVQAFFNNQDINGNIRYVKLSPDAKWQIVAYDFDYSVTGPYPDWDVALGSYQLGEACQRLLSNSKFKQILFNACADMYSKGFGSSLMLDILDELLEYHSEHDIQKECERFNYSYNRWVNNTKALRNDFTEERMSIWLYGLKDITDVTKADMHEAFPEYYG